MTDDRIVAEADVVTKLSHQSVPDTVAKLTAMINAKGMRLFAVIDQAAEARQAGLTLRETTLVLFGSPAAGTPVMAASPLSALDLPLKVLIWADGDQTKVSYYAPAALGRQPPVSPTTWPRTWRASTPSPTHSWLPSGQAPRPPAETMHSFGGSGTGVRSKGLVLTAMIFAVAMTFIGQLSMWN